MFNKGKALTYAGALKLQGKAANEALIKTLERYVQSRISWLLRDLGHQEHTNDQEFIQKINEYISKAIQNLSYDDAKEMLLTLLSERRFSNEKPVQKKKMIELLEGAMKNVGLERPHYDLKSGKRILKASTK